MFIIFDEKEKELLQKSLKANRPTYGTWRLWNFLLPFIIFLVPIGIVLFDDYNFPKMMQISVNGNLPLIPLMILISLISLNLSKSTDEQDTINSINRKLRTIAAFTGFFAFIFYVTETIEDRSKYYLIYLILSIITLLLSNYISKIYFLIQRRSITEVRKVERRISSERQLAK